MKSLTIVAWAVFLATSAPRAAEKATDTDAQVLKCIIANLKTNIDFATFAGRDRERRTIILVSKITPEKVGFSESQMGHDAGRKIPEEEFQDMLSRNAIPGTHDNRRVSFEGFNFGSNVSVIDTGELTDLKFYNEHPTALGWIDPFLPGYSKDGNHALFRAWKGPAPHSGHVTAFLTNVGGEWSIVWIKVAYWV